MTRQIIGQWKDGPNGTYRRRRSASGKWYTEAIYTKWNDNPPPTKQVAVDPLKSTRATPKSVEKAPNLWAWAILIFWGDVFGDWSRHRCIHGPWCGLDVCCHLLTFLV